MKMVVFYGVPELLLMSYISSTKVLHVQNHLLEVICGGLNWTVTLKSKF